MSALPHDVTDLYLAPVVLAIDGRIQRLGELSVEELSRQVALDSDKADWTRDLREAGLLATVTHLTECHGWELTWDPRGIRMAHGSHQIVLGVPATFVQFLAGARAGAGSV